MSIRILTTVTPPPDSTLGAVILRLQDFLWYDFAHLKFTATPEVFASPPITNLCPPTVGQMGLNALKIDGHGFTDGYYFYTIHGVIQHPGQPPAIGQLIDYGYFFVLDQTDQWISRQQFFGFPPPPAIPLIGQPPEAAPAKAS